MNGLIKRLLELKKWKELNGIQKKAVADGILDGKGNFVVIAPTASGKTGIAEIAILQELDKHGKAIYAVPSHALVDDKLRDFQYLAPPYKILEGASNFSEWNKADLVVTTFELVYRTCLLSKDFLKDFGLVVVDEFHILYDPSRGYNLEKLLTILKESKSRMFCLSATFEDKAEISEWLQAKVIYIPDKLRPVPIIPDIIDVRKTVSNAQLCKALAEKNKQPYLIFCATKNYTKERALEMCSQLANVKNDRQEMIKEVKKLIAREELPELEQVLCECLEKGVGFHHSDLHVGLRNFVAELFRNRKIDYLFCTTGLAYGINFPAKAVVIADLTLYDAEERSSNPIPTYLFLQMAGRAGRPQFDKEGFCFMTVKKDEDLDKFEEYKAGGLPRAESQIIRDEYFLKAILELVYSKRNTDDEIINFFKNSLFHFQATRRKEVMIAYDLLELLKKRVKLLYDTSFLELLGTKYQLTDFGKVTLDYLFSGFSSPELSAFVQLNQYLENRKSVEFNFDLVYFLSRFFPDCRISKQPYVKAKEVEDFLENRGISDRTSQQYSAYAVFYKWIENVSETEIDKECKVYSSNLPSKMWEMYKLLCAYENLARARGLAIPTEYQVFKDRIRHGVREDELPLVKIHGIGRELARSIRRHCNAVLKVNFGYSGTPVEILKTLLEKQGETEFLKHMDVVPNIGETRAKRLLTFVKDRLSKKNCR